MYHLDSYSQEVMHSHVIQKLRELRKQRVADSEIAENLKLTQIYDKVEICKHYKTLNLTQTGMPIFYSMKAILGMIWTTVK